MSSLIYIFSFLFVLSIVVVVHEFGHFWVARRCGVEVVAFSLGFGKKLFSRKDKKGTEWRVCAVPFGGYVQMLGDTDVASSKSSDEGLTEEQKKHTFMAQSLWKKALIIFAGPFMNYLFAVLLLTGVLMLKGTVHMPAFVGEIAKDSPAEKYGMQVGDEIKRINGKDVMDFHALQRALFHIDSGEEMLVSVIRNGKNIDLVFEPEEKGKMRRLGILSDVTKATMKEPEPFLKALYLSCQMAWQMTTDTLFYLKQVLTGRRSADDMRGPLGIAEASGDAARQGGFALLFFIIQISISIGFINLLPIPLLDGGHLATYAIEGVIRRPVPAKFQTICLNIGMALLLFVFVFTLYKDVPRIYERIFSKNAPKTQEEGSK